MKTSGFVPGFVAGVVSLSALLAVFPLPQEGFPMDERVQGERGRALYSVGRLREALSAIESSLKSNGPVQLELTQTVAQEVVVLTLALSRADAYERALREEDDE